MDIATMRNRVRRDLVDEGSPSRFSDDELDRAISRAVMALSGYYPQRSKNTIATVAAGDEIDISELTDVISIDRVEFPIGNMPRAYARFETFGSTIRLLDTIGDGNNCYVYYSTPHILDADGSTVPVHLEDLVALGASGYAVLSLAQAKIDTNNPGGSPVNDNYQQWAMSRLNDFERGLQKLNSKVRTGRLYLAD
jgi:hypothetical protein